MKDKIVLITGATSGIGKVTALELAKKNYHVIIHGRNEAKAEQVASEIKSKTNNDNVDYLIADLYSMDAINEMTNKFKDNYDHLDVLINNAGAVLNNKRQLSHDGLEVTMALNVIAPYLLTQLLLDWIKKSDDGRIINMSSSAYRASGKPDMNDLNLGHVKSAQRRYSLSKLYVLWNTKHLAHMLKQQKYDNVTVYASEPGAVATKFGQDSDKGPLVNFVYKTAMSLYKSPLPLNGFASPERGASTNIYLASSLEVKGITGKFWGKSKPKKVSQHYYTRVKEQSLWDYCFKVCRKYLVR